MKKILILTANPKNTDRLRLDEEVREIQAVLDQSRHRDQVELVTRWAVRVSDLQPILLEHNPQVVHFSGHGVGEDGLALENDAGVAQMVSAEALSRLFKASRGILKCVFLNACYSQVQAEAIYQTIDCVIGMNKPIGDRAAIRFAPSFYQALLNGAAFQDAYEYACTALALEGSSELSTPQLLNRNESADPLAIVAPAVAPTPPSQVAEPPPPPRAHKQSQSIGTISVSGSNNPFNAIQAGGNVTVSQTSTQSSGGNTDLDKALALLAQLKQTVATSSDLSAFAKKDTDSKIGMLQEELQKPTPDKSFVNEVVEALKQGLSGVLTLVTPVTQVAALLAKAWVSLP